MLPLLELVINIMAGGGVAMALFLLAVRAGRTSFLLEVFLVPLACGLGLLISLANWAGDFNWLLSGKVFNEWDPETNMIFDFETKIGLGTTIGVVVGCQVALLVRKWNQKRKSLGERLSDQNVGDGNEK